MNLFFLEVCFTGACLAIIVLSILTSGMILEALIDRYARRTRKLPELRVAQKKTPLNPQDVTYQQEKEWRYHKP